MARLHEEPLKEIVGIPVTKTEDYKNLVSVSADGTKTRIEGLPSSDVLKYFLEDGSTVSVRPSGTEPKVKFYLEAVGNERAFLQGKIDSLDAGIRKAAGCR